ncbi:MAG TPA: ATP-binding cassette domain-containing protein [bacterium]
MPLFELTEASIGYNGAPVLKDITLKIEPGERVAFVGPSGAGKSTLLSTLYAQQRARAALVPQEYALVKHLSVFHNVYMGRLHRHSSLYNLLNLMHPLASQIGAVQPILTRLGMTELMGKPVGELSGGQQQRTAVARALFQGGEVLLGDEPVSSVDPLQSRSVLEAINAAFPTVVLAMHDLELALDFTERLIGLKDGRVAFDRPSAGLRAGDLDAFYRPT